MHRIFDSSPYYCTVDSVESSDDHATVASRSSEHESRLFGWAFQLTHNDCILYIFD